MGRIIAAVILAILFHVALFAFEPDFLIKRPGKIQKPAITVRMSYRKKPASPPPVKKTPEIKKKKKKKTVKKENKPAPVEVKEKEPEPEPVKEPEIVEAKVETEEEVIDQEPVEFEESEQTEPEVEQGFSDAVTEAIPLYKINPEPGYPKMARKRGYQGIVLLSVHVTKEGTVDDLWLYESCGYKILDNAALKAVKDWTFEPGRRGDETVEMWVEVPVVFELN